MIRHHVHATAMVSWKNDSKTYVETTDTYDDDDDDDDAFGENDNMLHL